MNQTATADEAPATIRARIHDNVIKRVTRIFTSSLADIFAEVFQNARRAGATRIHVTVAGSDDDGSLTVTVSDNGTGIADPAVLLSFGENGWSEDLVYREDAAGMGFLSLARRGCAIASRLADAVPGWRVSLAAIHFLGEDDAEVQPDNAAPWPHGTAVTFPATQSENVKAIRHAVGNAARHYPLPVTFEDLSVVPGESEEIERSDFLDGAIHTETWQGVAFGVFRNRRINSLLNNPDVNFHGVTVPVRLPTVETVHGVCWSVAADIRDCPDLELVLPARKEAVETPFLQEMRKAALLAIYRAMAAADDPRPAFEDWKQAREAGIDIAAPPAELQPWRPAIADVDDWRDPPKLLPVPEDALIMACDPEPPEAQAFGRAAMRAGKFERPFEGNARLKGYDWYDALSRIVDLRTHVVAGGWTYPLDQYPVPERTGAPQTPLPVRPGSVRIDVTAVARHGGKHVTSLHTDLAFAGEAWSWVGDALPLVTADSDLEPRDLADLLRAAFFSPSDDPDADSWERQRDDFDREALHIATRLLVSDDAARRTSIANTIRREVAWLIPSDRAVDIAIRGADIVVALGPSGSAGRTEPADRRRS